MDININVIKGYISIIVGILVKWLGGNDSILILLLVLMGMDIVTGLMKAFSTKSVNPEKMYHGGFKKISILLVVIVANLVGMTFGDSIPLREITIVYYIVQEFISFSENILTFNSMPDELREFFEKLNNRKDGK